MFVVFFEDLLLLLSKLQYNTWHRILRLEKHLASDTNQACADESPVFFGLLPLTFE